MSKVVDCGEVNPASGCGHVIKAETEEELMRLVAEHAKNEHNLEPTPELVEQVKAHIHNA